MERREGKIDYKLIEGAMGRKKERGKKGAGLKKEEKTQIAKSLMKARER